MTQPTDGPTGGLRSQRAVEINKWQEKRRSKERENESKKKKRNGRAREREREIKKARKK